MQWLIPESQLKITGRRGGRRGPTPETGQGQGNERQQGEPRDTVSGPKREALSAEGEERGYLQGPRHTHSESLEHLLGVLNASQRPQALPFQQEWPSLDDLTHCEHGEVFLPDASIFLSASVAFLVFSDIWKLCDPVAARKFFQGKDVPGMSSKVIGLARSSQRLKALVSWGWTRSRDFVTCYKLGEALLAAERFSFVLCKHDIHEIF